MTIRPLITIHDNVYIYRRYSATNALPFPFKKLAKTRIELTEIARPIPDFQTTNTYCFHVGDVGVLSRSDEETNAHSRNQRWFYSVSPTARKIWPCLYISIHLSPFFSIATLGTWVDRGQNFDLRENFSRTPVPADMIRNIAFPFEIVRAPLRRARWQNYFSLITNNRYELFVTGERWKAGANSDAYINALATEYELIHN